MVTVLAVGESLVDLISAEIVDDLGKAGGFRRYVGGQVTNLALNIAQLGVKVVLCSCVGEDSLGAFVRHEIERAGLSSACIQTTPQAATSVSIIARQTGTPDFVIHRGADSHLRWTAALGEAFRSCQILHTSAFALSREPARSLILNGMREAKENGALVSVDPNYHPHIWPDAPDFLRIFEDACQYVDVAKPSLDDCHRIFGPGLTEEQYASRFMAWGVETVIITLGAGGAFLARTGGHRVRIHSNHIRVSDVTGAGDAFWAGYLWGCLAGALPLDAARLGQVLAERKIRTVGPASEFPPNDELLQEAQSIRFERLETVKGGDKIGD